MPPKRRARGVGWASGFTPPTDDDADSALGPFPFESSRNRRSTTLASERRRVQPSQGEFDRPSLAYGCQGDDELALKQIDEEKYFREPHYIASQAEPELEDDDEEEWSGSDEPLSKRSRRSAPSAASTSSLSSTTSVVSGKPTRGTSSVWTRINEPADEQDWLAQYTEEGQTFEEFLNDISMRSGRFNANHFGGMARTDDLHAIGIVPIVRKHALNSEAAWPAHGPSLELLKEFTEIYFDRPVVLLDTAVVELERADRSKPGGFSHRLKWKDAYTARERRLRPVRVHTESDRLQMHVNPLLAQLSSIRTSRSDAVNRCFCLMGVTMEDLYSDPSDLFVAGMAAGGSNVAVFSFHRYHPNIKMDPGEWADYGYVSKPSTYSYYEDGRKRPPITASPSDVMTEKAKREMLRRAAKLLVHELMHIYGIDHCIYAECIMKGTGHLVEDFMAPLELCGVDLRKMQWRLGFDVVGRYRQMCRFCESNGWKDDVKWLRARLEQLDAPQVESKKPPSKVRPAAAEAGKATEVIDLSQSPDPK